MRYLYRVDDDQPFAYAHTRRDFFLVSDDSLWAHESHQWLLSAVSGASLVHRIGNVYYDVDSALPLYYESSEPPALADHRVSISGESERRGR
jgi:hypothetical protein